MNTPAPTAYGTKPQDLTTMPPGIPYIIGNEAAERFSFYGMRTILVVFMTKYLLDSSGQPAPLSDAEAREYYHLFSAAVYFFPILGGFLADLFLGKYLTILVLSIVYCFGHLALGLDETKMGLLVGLGLIAIGSGGIKPCVSAHVGDQFGRGNKHLIPKVFSYFYFSVNFGAFFSTLLTPWLLEHYGPSVAFGIPGVLMAIATFVFWMGRNKFVHIPPGRKEFLKEIVSPDGLKVIGKLFIIYAFVAIFWSLYDQTGSAWVLQAQKMNLNFAGIEWLASQVQAVNPILILLYIPILNKLIIPTVEKFVKVTPLRKISFGLFLTVPSFLVTWYVESQIVQGLQPNIAWHILAYVFLTSAEVLVSITCLEFSYTQATNRMKSFIMSLFLISVSIGNIFTAAVNSFIQNADGTTKLTGPEYYLFFAGVMTLTALIFIPVAYFYKEREYIQGVE